MRKALTGVGALLLVASATLFAGQLFGLVPVDALTFAGQSAFRTIASAAVGGCLMIAIGCWEH